MNNLLDSLWEWFQEKTSSPFWYTLFFSFILWNWQILYLLFWEDTSKSTISKVEHICKNYFWWSNIWPECNFINAIWNNFWLILYYSFPLIIAFLSIWVIPIISNFAFRKRLEFIEKRELDIMNSNTNLWKEKKNKAMSLVKSEEESMRKEQEYEWAHEKN